MIKKSQIAALTQIEKMKSKIMKEALRINYGVGQNETQENDKKVDLEQL